MKTEAVLTKLKASKVLLALFLSAIAFTSCDSDSSPEPGSSVQMLQDTRTENAFASTFVAPMDGFQEVATPRVMTRAIGYTIFELKPDGLHYTLVVNNIHNVTQAHIHAAPAGVNGGVVTWLYPSAPPAKLIPGMFNGILSTGVITSSRLVGALAGRPLEDLLQLMQTSNAYVNVHTSQYPAGEIRGQIKPY